MPVQEVLDLITASEAEPARAAPERSVITRVATMPEEAVSRLLEGLLERLVARAGETPPAGNGYGTRSVPTTLHVGESLRDSQSRLGETRPRAESLLGQIFEQLWLR